MQGDEAGCVSTRVGWSISIPLSRRRRKQCRECSPRMEKATPWTYWL